jgi:hypothetical protein
VGPRAVLGTVVKGKIPSPRRESLHKTLLAISFVCGLMVRASRLRDFKQLEIFMRTSLRHNAM